MNRVRAAVEKLRAEIVWKLEQGIVTPEKVEQTRRSLDMGLEEYVVFQTKKSLAFQTEALTLEEAQYIYGLLGESLNTFNSLPVAEKAVLTKVFTELLGQHAA